MLFLCCCHCPHRLLLVLSIVYPLVSFFTLFCALSHVEFFLAIIACHLCQTHFFPPPHCHHHSSSSLFAIVIVVVLLLLLSSYPPSSYPPPPPILLLLLLYLLLQFNFFCPISIYHLIVVFVAPASPPSPLSPILFFSTHPPLFPQSLPVIVPPCIFLLTL